MEHLLDHHVLAGEEDVCVPIHHWEPCLCAVDELWHLSDQRSSSVMTTKTENGQGEHCGGRHRQTGGNVVSASLLVDDICLACNHSTSQGGCLARGMGSREVWMHGMYGIG